MCRTSRRPVLRRCTSGGCSTCTKNRPRDSSPKKWRWKDLNWSKQDLGCLVAILVLATIILPWVRDESQSGADPNLQLPLVGVALSGNGRVLFVQQDVWTVELEEEYFL